MVIKVLVAAALLLSALPAMATTVAGSFDGASESGTFSYDAAAPQTTLFVTLDYDGLIYSLGSDQTLKIEGDRYFEMRASFETNPPSVYFAYFDLTIAPNNQASFLTDDNAGDQNFALSLRDTNGVLSSNDGGINITLSALPDGSPLTPVVDASFDRINSFKIEMVDEPPSFLVFAMVTAGVALYRAGSYRLGRPRYLGRQDRALDLSA